MADSFASGKTKAVLPTFGSYVDTWNQPVNADMSTIDAALSGTTSINVASILSSSPFVNITFSEFNATANPTPWTQPNAGQNLRINLIGVLTFGITVYLQRIPGFWIFSNNTAGSFPITVSTTASSGTSVIIPQGYSSVLFSDGTNVIWADQGNLIANSSQEIPPGAIMSFGMIAVPFGWIACNGAAVSRTAYAGLFAAIGTVWGTGDGSTTFNVPNFLGSFLRGWNGTASGLDANRAFGSFQADAYLNHTHTATSTDAGHTHNILNTGPNANGGGAGWLVNPQADTGLKTLTGTANITTTVNASTTGDTETRPDNFAVQYCIKT